MIHPEQRNRADRYRADAAMFDRTADRIEVLRDAETDDAVRSALRLTSGSLRQQARQQRMYATAVLGAAAASEA